MKRFFALLIAFMLVLSFAACAQENKEELYEEMLVNFGATIKHDGTLVVSRKGSFYDFREGIEDCSALGANEFYTWVASRSENSDKTKVLLSDTEVYAYSADYYEGEVTKYFGVSAEYLQSSDFYYAEQNSYFSDAVSSSDDYTYIEFISAEENDGKVTILFALSTITGEAVNYTLTAELLSGGAYNYISYLPA